MKLTTLLSIFPVALAASDAGNTKRAFIAKAAAQGSDFDGLPFNALFNSFFLGHSPNVTAFVGDDGDALDEDGKEAGFLACPVDGPGGIASLAWKISVALPDEVLPEGLREGLRECVEGVC
ncbi:uncharacterized protein ASPGLDRAFT_37627 [Aspergillus glaucus CBS 516.65]|uniref:Uncharacterized protein n=1 Tax=Aspergillus glaucus CBS 516.65 TaxID=1160497 RepID=A0A1L9VD47_ASPGL|nr:hypothetical protein ASPGLDRAFT_37627 [Aspergillus glaucus CBS 516.65]OJJ81803.1 hypothetical protein ASPGLDRAFT_37627 [Aspergillus glaucus CBS 516.65]